MSVLGTSANVIQSLRKINEKSPSDSLPSQELQGVDFLCLLLHSFVLLLAELR